ncbi:MAG: hypothetical protein N4A33_09390 [Bacteriovoracaceae bacterium]|jgi:hypothetical protein|nr:hypothetical protein [Bacteriovoracaceae bacterium]
MNKNKERLFLLRQLSRKKLLKTRRRDLSRAGASFYSSYNQFNGPASFGKKSELYPNTNIIVPPTVFSLSQNIDETIKFFEDFQILISLNQPIFINLKEVKTITPGALLYILSILRSIEEKNIFISIRANRPQDPECRHFIEQSGFYNHTGSNKKPEHTDNNLMEIVTGNEADPDQIIDIKNFCIEKLDIDRYSRKGQAFWANLVECTANTNNHAYETEKSKNDIFLNQWWAIAVFKEGKVETTFLDNGSGIPGTVKKHLFSMQHLDSDSTLINKALLGGVIKSRTGKEHRNKGLPKMLERVNKDNLVDKLTIISDKGYLEIDSTEITKKDLKHSFKGTLLHWEVSNIN